MKRVTKKLAIAFLVGITAAAGMGITASAAKKNSVKITVKPDNIKLAIGECIKIKKSATPKDPNQKWKFSSRDKDIALVSRNGNIVGLKGGTARIRVRAAGKNTVKTIKVKVDGNSLYVCKTSLAKFIKMGIATKEEDKLNYTIKDQTWGTIKFSNRTLTDTYITMDNVKANNTYIESSKSYWINARTSQMGKVLFVPKDSAATTKFEDTHVRPVLEIGTMSHVDSARFRADGLIILDPGAAGGTVVVEPGAGETVNAGIQGGRDLNVEVQGGEGSKSNIDLNNSDINDVVVDESKNQTVTVSPNENATEHSHIGSLKAEEGADNTKFVVDGDIDVGKVESAAEGTIIETPSGEKEVPKDGSVTNPNDTTTGGGGGGGTIFGQSHTISHYFQSHVGDVVVTFEKAGDATFKRTDMDQLLQDVLANKGELTITASEGHKVTFTGAPQAIPENGKINASGITATVTKDGETVGTYRLSVTGTYGKEYTVRADWDNGNDNIVNVK